MKTIRTNEKVNAMSKSIARKSLAVLMALVLACWQLPAYSFADETEEAAPTAEETPVVVDDKPAPAESESPAESEPAPTDEATGEGEQAQPAEGEQPAEPQAGEEGADAESAEGEGDAAADEDAEAADAEKDDNAEKPDKAAQKNTQKTFTAEADGVQVTAMLAKPSALPKGVKFAVTRVTAGSGYNYDAYMEALNGGADEPSYTDENTMLFDVAFTDKSGVEVQPGKVDLAFSFSNHQLTDGLEAESASDVEVVHLPLTDAAMKNVDTTAQATDISAADVRVEGVNVNVNLSPASESVQFTLDSLSVVALGVPQEATLQEQADGGQTIRLFGYDIAWFDSSMAASSHSIIGKKYTDVDVETARLAYEGDDALFANLASSVSGMTMYGQHVVNPNTNVDWVLAGFVPFEYGGYTLDMRNNGKGLKCDSILEEYISFTSEEDAQQYIADNGGVLYGELATEDLLSSGGDIVTVWVQKETFAPTHGPGAVMREFNDVAPRTPVNYEPTTEGLDVSAEAVPGSPSKVTFTVVIPEDMDADEINIDTLDLGEWSLTVQPGDQVDYTINVIDKSGSYVYKEKSGAEGTVEQVPSASNFQGFEGYSIPMDTELGEHSPVARRGLNKPIVDLLNDIYGNTGWAGQYDYLIEIGGFDYILGDALIAHGYGASFDDNGNVKTFQGDYVPVDKYVIDGESGIFDYTALIDDYLHLYYLDWFSENQGGDYTSFDQLSKDQIGILYKGENMAQAAETNHMVDSALYWGFYEYLFPVSGDGQDWRGSHTWMVKPDGFGDEDGNTFDEVTSSQWEASEEAADDAVAHTIEYHQYIDGEFSGNNLQNTRFSIGVQFKLVKQDNGIRFTKYLYGEGAGTFEFALHGLGGFDDTQSPENLAAMIPASLDADAPAEGKVTIDQKTCADLQMVSSISMDATGEQDGGFSRLKYGEAGEYYFVVGELTGDEPGIVYDDQVRYVAHVSVWPDDNGKLVASEPDYLMCYPNTSGGYDSLGAVDAIEFYNNGALGVEFMAMGMAYYEEDAARVSVYPEVEKTVNEGVDLLKDGEFSFQLFDSQGTLLRQATNDEIGNVAFYDEKTDTGLVFEEEGKFTYTINEVIPEGTHPDSETGKPNLDGVTYDDSVVTMEVDVTKGEDGVLKVAVTYKDASGEVIAGTDANGAKLGDGIPTIPTFKNYKDTVDLKVRKVSRADGKPLAGCTYALWMKGVAGDVMIAEAISGDDGYIVFEDVHLVSGQQYYYKEVAAPDGYTVDPHRTAYFELDDSGKLVVTEEVAEDGWHSRYE